MSDSKVILESNLPGVKLLSRGKVRDIYEVGDELLIVASDRISAFDYILNTGIPRKGEVLTQLSLFWFDFFKDVVPTHIITANVDTYVEPLPQFRDQLEGRSMLVNRADMLQIECVARGYLSGSGWKDYQQTGAVCGIALPDDLLESSILPEPIFTPSTKASSGHDINISFEEAAGILGADVAAKARDLTLDIYSRAAKYARDRGIIIADTKFEFGFVDGELVLADEVLTPDSSRFWPADEYEPGRAQRSFDKQYVRDYLESIHWNKQPPVPSLPAEVVQGTRNKYLDAYRRLAGRELEVARA
jgi:phosphoribosylaminoimidazole-succinocarboxamide synthase